MRPFRRELNTLAMVMAAGIDHDQAADRVTLTVQILKPDEVKPPAGRMGGTEGSKGVWVAESSAKNHL